MSATSKLTKWCPVCGDAMCNVPTDGRALMFRCVSCRAEVVKAPPSDSMRRRLPLRDRPLGRLRM